MTIWGRSGMTTPRHPAPWRTSRAVAACHAMSCSSCARCMSHGPSGHNAPLLFPPCPHIVMPGLVPGIHTAARWSRLREIPGTSPGMTEGVSGHRLRPVRAWGAGRCSGRLTVFGMGLPFHPSPFRSSRRLPEGGTLYRAYPARGRLRAGGRFAPARFARLIARPRPRARGRLGAHLACRSNRGRSAPDRRGREAVHGCRFPRTHPITGFPGPVPEEGNIT